MAGSLPWVVLFFSIESSNDGDGLGGLAEATILDVTG